jgi:predicted PurR-regulated permease PerM
MSPFIVLLAVFFWSFLWGIAGAFIGLPMTIAILTICEQHKSTEWIALLLSGRERKQENKNGDGVAYDPRV